MALSPRLGLNSPACLQFWALFQSFHRKWGHVATPTGALACEVSLHEEPWTILGGFRTSQPSTNNVMFAVACVRLEACKGMATNMPKVSWFLGSTAHTQSVGSWVSLFEATCCLVGCVGSEGLSPTPGDLSAPYFCNLLCGRFWRDPCVQHPRVLDVWHRCQACFVYVSA